MYEAFNECGLNLDILNHCQEFLVTLGKHKTQALNWYFFYFLLQLAVKLANISLYIRTTSFTLVVLFFLSQRSFQGSVSYYKEEQKLETKIHVCLLVLPVFLFQVELPYCLLATQTSCIWAHAYEHLNMFSFEKCRFLLFYFIFLLNVFSLIWKTRTKTAYFIEKEKKIK